MYSAPGSKTIDFTNIENAKKRLAEELIGRLKEQEFHRDARVQKAIASLSAEEVALLKHTKQFADNTVWGQEVKGIANWWGDALQRLLDKGLVQLMGEFDEKKAAFAFTPLGAVIRKMINSGLRKFEADPPLNPPEQKPPAPEDSTPQKTASMGATP